MKRSTLVCLALIFIAAPALAQLHPVLERGFAPDKIYRVGDVDSVNPFNGNLIISLPLGPTYPVGGDLNYQLTLTYNSMLWDYYMAPDDTHPLCDSKGPEAPIDPPGERDCVNLAAEPTPLANAGLGWRLSLGDLLAKGQPGNTVPTWLYIAPDGSQHAFVETLHESDSTDTDVWYTRDDSYMRMKVVAYGGAGNPIKMSIEAANGITREFTRYGLVWRLMKIKDSFGNYLKINYYETYWKLTDSVGRVHKIHWTNVAGEDVVNKVEFAAFGTSSPAVYQLVYDASNGNIIEQSCKDNHFGNGTTLSVPLLTEVRFPDGSAYKMKNSAGNPAYYDDNYRLPGHTCTIPRSGILNRLVLPTGGVREWQFARTEFPTGSGTGGCVEEGDEFRQVGLGVTAGVAERKVISAAGQSATWTYDYPHVSDQTADSIIRTITSPDNDDTVHYFRTQACQYDETANGHIAWTGWDYGLPFNPGITKDGRFRSVAFYDGTGGSRFLKRARYVLYEHDQLPPLVLGSPRTWYDSNRRVAEPATYFVDDGWKKAERESSIFDGLGHYRTKTLDGFSSGARTEMTNFNPTRGTYSINPTTNTYTGNFLMLAPTEAWILNTYDYTKQTEGAVTAKQEHCFDTSTGKLERTRTLKSGTSRNAHDLLAIFGYGGAGNLISESYYGGDSAEQELDVDAPACDLDLDDLPTHEYRLNHSYLYGVRRKSTYASTTVNLLDTDIDKNTGLVKKSRDVSGFGTSWTYDKSGRVTAVTPDAGAKVTVSYTRATGDVTNPGFNPAKIDVNFKTHSGGSTLAREKFEFDGVGRLTVEKRLLPDATWAEKLTRYTLMGLPLQVSEWVVEGGTHRWTTYSSYDPFGRAGKITFPDSKHVDFTFTGDRISTRKAWLGVAKSGSTIIEDDFTTTTHHDYRGRVTEVFEPANTSQNVHATFGYDIGGRLANISTWVPEGFLQWRMMNYDNRGFLISETMPEKGASGNGTVTYSYYDSRGHVGRVSDGPNRLSYTYDKAERLTRAKETYSPSRILETRTYAAYNSGSDLRKGKLTRAIRHNFYDGAQDFKVDESYVYAGLGGRVSQRTTTAGVSGGVFTQSFVWDELGVLKTENYPLLSGGGPLPRTGPNRKVSYWYTKGFLTAVPGFANEISYHASGMTHQTVHSNGVTDTRALDSYGMARPRKISTSGADLNWSSGIYAYDGAGNITKTGGEWYLYDGLGRLKEGTAKNSAGSRKTRKLTYDGFGNLTSIWTTGIGTRTINVNHSTNRLTGSSYDAAGNQTSWGSGSLTYTYAYYPFNQIRTISGGSPSVDRWYAYTADGERIASFASDAGGTTFAVRGLEGQVLREYLEKNGAWTWKKDYVRGADGLLATISPDEGTMHFTLDHLGTPRLACDRCADRMAQHNYFPFGEEATDAYQDTAKMKFTGHERDLNRDGQTTDDLDYMHARYYTPNLGRFMSVDPVGGSVGSSQSYNRYMYVLGSPLKFTDRNGEDLHIVYDFSRSGLTSSQQARLIAAVYRVYRAAGVSRTYSYRTGNRNIPSQSSLRPFDRVVRVLINKSDHLGGRTNQDERTSIVFYNSDFSGSALIKGIANVTGHEIGHATGLLPWYDWHDEQTPYVKAGCNTIMATGLNCGDPLTENLLSMISFGFDPQDAAQLQKMNPPEYETGAVGLHNQVVRCNGRYMFADQCN